MYLFSFLAFVAIQEMAAVNITIVTTFGQETPETR